MKQKIIVLTNGCPENRYDGAQIKNRFIQNQWIYTNQVSEADVIVFNTCGQSYIKNRKDRVIPALEMLKEIQRTKKPSAEIIVCGCLPKINPTELEKAHQGKIIYRNELKKLTELYNLEYDPQFPNNHNLIPYTTTIKKINKRNIKKFFSYPLKTQLLFLRIRRKSKKLEQEINAFRDKTYVIKVSTGCLSNCAFCTIRKSRGLLKSKPIEKIISELKEGIQRGYTEFGFLGTDVGAYGRDHKQTLVDLFNEIIKIKADFTVRIRNINPKYLIEMYPKLKRIFKTGKISYIESSAESGSNRILKKMRRMYKIEDYIDVIKSINQEFPDIKIRTQIIIGFPGETDEDFKETLQLFDKCRFDSVEIYEYRPEKISIKDDQYKPVRERKIHRWTYQLRKKIYS
jgi:tRNA A37 methylthiotransferase MiaB